jgi:tetratricopeptide (TPR) repeat protein
LQDEAEALGFVRQAETPAHVWLARGIVAKMRNDPNGAVTAFTAALKQLPNYSAALINRGLTFRRLGNHRCAVSDFTQAIQLKPDEPAAFCGRAFVWKDLGEEEKALEDFDRALLLKPDYVPALTNRGLLFRSLSNAQRATEDLERVVPLSPRNAHANYNLALAYYDVGLLADAKYHLDKAIKLSPSADAYNQRAIIYRWLNLPRRAARDAEHALAIFPSDITAKMNLAGAMMEAGQIPKGKELVGGLMAELDKSEVYGHAALHAIAGESNTALQLLGACADLDVKWLQSDPDFKSLHQDPAFRTLAELEASDAWRPRGSNRSTLSDRLIR